MLRVWFTKNLNLESNIIKNEESPASLFSYFKISMLTRNIFFTRTQSISSSNFLKIL